MVLSLLGRVDQKDQAERLKVGRFLIQAQWFPEALVELDRLELDYPSLKDTVAMVRASVLDLRSRRQLKEVDIRMAAQQPREAENLLSSLLSGPAAEAVLETVRVLLQEFADAARGGSGAGASGAGSGGCAWGDGSGGVSRGHPGDASRSV